MAGSRSTHLAVPSFLPKLVRSIVPPGWLQTHPSFPITGIQRVPVGGAGSAALMHAARANRRTEVLESNMAIMYLLLNDKSDIMELPYEQFFVCQASI